MRNNPYIIGGKIPFGTNIITYQEMETEGTAMSVKILSIYLPQYYQTEYNDKWWGEGYTEWKACRGAAPLFTGHRQPRKPYREYDLSDYHTIARQAEMAKENGIEGFAIYQYYSLGNKLLNVPTELLLNHKEINISYCLYWANESWERRWYGQNPEVLWEQEYGTKKDWEKQFGYCLPFFQDGRYIKIDEKPVYLIYKDWNFNGIEKFIQCWQELAKKSGFKGIYFIKTVAGRNNDNLGSFDAAFEREPFYTLNKSIGMGRKIYRYARTRTIEILNRRLLLKKGKGVIQYTMDYKECCDLIKKRGMPNGKHTIPGVFTDWDNSPRRQYNSTIFMNTDPEIFGDCLKEQLKKAERYNSPFVIINAWNEWGESNYLEPDELYGDGFLRAVKAAANKNKDEPAVL